MRSILFGIVFLVFISGVVEAQVWTPPENPDPHAILNEARDDAKARRFEIALAKHVWYFENAIKHRPSQRGVRRSFAISDWHKLAMDYEPAYLALLEKRDQARESVTSSEDFVESFLDMASINNELKNDELTVEVFQEAEKKNREQARRIFFVAREALTRQREYKTVSFYLDNPTQDLEKAIERYKMRLETMNRPELQRVANNEKLVEMMTQRANKHLINQTATLVAILAVNERHEEAEKIAKTAKEKFELPELHRAVDDAVVGMFPETETE
ncbi:hypothetical protein [Lacunimicrobium album]